MANEIRVRSGVLAGTITDNPLLVGATTMNSARLADLPAIGATEHAALVLDPLGANGAPEVVWVTAHTASATPATISRGREGTTARQHPSGTTWIHAPTTNDYIRTVTSAPSGTGLPFDGQAWYHQTEKRLYVAEAGSGVRVAHTTTAGRTGGTWTRTANQSINSASITNISWDAETADSDGFCTPTSATITVPAGLGGLYAVTARVTHTWQNNGSLEFMRIVCSSAGTYSCEGDGNNAVCLQLALGIVVPLAAAETITVGYLQGTGGAQNVTGRIDVYRIGV